MSTKRRVLLKLSGEAFGGGSIGLDPKVVRNIAEQVATAVREGVQVAIVVGGGNFFRGAQLAREGLERSRADYMGMLGAVMNALALQDFIEQTCRCARFVTWRRGASLSSALVLVCRTSRLILSLLSVPWRFTVMSCSSLRTAWTASTTMTRIRIPMRAALTR